MSNWRTGLVHLPVHMRDGVRDYIENGTRPGGFLTAILANDLCGAVSRADMVNRTCIVEWAEYTMFCMPIGSAGSYEDVDRWVESGGLNAMEAQENE